MLLQKRPWTDYIRCDDLQRGLCGIMLPGSIGYNVTNNIVAGGFSVISGSYGVAAKAPAIQIAGAVWVDLLSPVEISGDYSWMIYGEPATGVGFGTVATHTLQSSGALSGNVIVLESGYFTAMLDGNWAPTINVSFNGPLVLFAIRRSNQVYCYVRGQVTSGITGTRSGTISGITAGRDRNIQANIEGTKTYMQALWNRALSNAEIVTVSANPWQLFQPRSTRIWTPAASSGQENTTPILTNPNATNVGFTTVSPSVRVEY